MARPSEQSPAPLRVLLISPVASLDPASGDVTYTQQLVSAPPPGVQYTTYDQALGQGSLVEIGARKSLREARGTDRLLHAGVALARKVEWLVRRSGWVYREPIRVFGVRPGAFDLAHVHVFHHRFLGARPPVVASAGGPLRWVYADAWNWAPVRLAIAEVVDRTLGRLWDATMCGARLGRADLFVSPSDYLREWLETRGWPSDRIAVQPNYLSSGCVSPPRHGAPRTLGFVARDFEAKGGPAVVEAFSTLRQQHKELRLVIVGSPPRLSENEQKTAGITWMSEVSREELLLSVLPSIDLLVYPSSCDTGVPYSTMEALSHSIPAVVSDYRSLPDLVGDDAGLVCRRGDTSAVVTAVEGLMDGATYAAASAAASRRFAEQFSARTQAPRLRALYDEAIARASDSASRPRKRSLSRSNGASTHL